MRIAIDTEFELATEVDPLPRLVSVAVSDGVTTRLYHHTDPELPHLLRGLFLWHHCVFAFAPADLFVLWRWRPELWPAIRTALDDGRIVDVIVNEDLIRTARGGQKMNGLADLVQKYLDRELDKGADTYRLRYGELYDVPIAEWPTEARQYAKLDALTTHQVDAAQAEHMALFGAAPPLVWSNLCLYRQTLIGIETDPERVREIDRQIGQRIGQLEQRMLDQGMARWVKKKGQYHLVRNQKQAQELALELTGSPSLRQDDLEQADLPEGHPLHTYRELGALQSSYTKNLVPFRHPRVRTSYRYAVSGRTTSGAPMDPFVGTNLQNLNREGDFRACLRPPPGHVFVVSDYGALELVALAEVCIQWLGESKLAEMLIEGRDPHAEFGMVIFGADGERYDKTNPDHKHARQGAKAYNFGKPGRMGMHRFIDYARTQYGFIITPRRERELDRLWHARFPEIRKYWRLIETMEYRPGKFRVEQIGGRVRGDMFLPDACNTPFQGLGADVARLSLRRLFEASLDPQSPLYRCPQVLFVHDEHVTVVPTERAEAAMREQERIMIAAAGELCTHVPIKVASVIAERYCKP